MSSVLSSLPPLATDGVAPSADLQTARLERCGAWARAEVARLRAAGEAPVRQRVPEYNAVAAHKMMVAIIQGRRNAGPQT